MNPLPPAPDPRHGLPAPAGMMNVPVGGPLPPMNVPPPPPIVTAPPSGMALLKALKRRWQLAAIVAPVASILVAAAIWFFTPPAQYVARGTLELNPTPPNPILRSSAGNEPNLDNFRQLQIALIKNQKVLIAALRDPKLSQLQTLREVDNPLQWLEQSMSFSAPGNAQVLQVMLQGKYPEDLRLLLNAVIKTFLSEFVTAEQEIRSARLASLKKYKEQYQEELNKAKVAKQQFSDKGASNANVVALQMAFLQAEVQRRQGEIGKLETEVAELEAQQKQMTNRDPTRVPLDNEIFREFFAQDVEMQNLETERRIAKESLTDAKLKGFRESVTDKLKEKLDAIEKQIRARQQELRSQAEEYWKQRSTSDFAKHSVLVADSLELKNGLLEKYHKELDRTKFMLENLSRNQNRLDDLAFDSESLKEFFRQIDAEERRLRINANDLSRVREIEEPRVLPSDPKARQLKMAALGGALTFLLVLAGLSLWEFHGRRVESVDQIVYGLGLPLVGTVPAMPKQRLLGLAGGLKEEEVQAWRFALQEAVAAARTMLLNAARTTNMRMGMITSAMPGEGKTSLSTQLAVSMAMAGHRTLLLDFDMRNPSAHKLLGMSHTPGWAEILRGEINVADAIRQTNLEKLSFIAAGDCDPVALKSLVQEELGQVLNWLRSQYDFVIVDTCPVLPVVDALLLGRHMDGVIFSVLNEVSQIPKIYVATQRVAQLGIRTLGAVVNGIREDKYGYGSYGYGYRKAGQKKRTPPDPQASQNTPPPGTGQTTPKPGDANQAAGES